MARYVIERDVRHWTKEDYERAGPKSVSVLDQMAGIVWIKSYVCEAEGKIYCEYEAPSIDLIMEHARRAGFPANRISEISVEISPAMFR